MNYLITGSNGFIGTNLKNYLDTQGHGVISIDYPTDLCFYEPSTSIAPIHSVIHLAAETNVRESVQFPERTFLRNCQSTLKALEIARMNSSKFVLASSISAEKSLSPYAASKLASESICKSYQECYGLEVSILRLANIFGPFSAHKTSVIAKFIKNILNDKPIEIYGSGLQTRDFVYVEDLVSYFATSDEKFTCSTGHQRTIISIAQMLNKIAYELVGKESPIIHLEKQKGELFHSANPFNITPSNSFYEQLESTFQWFVDDRN